MSTQFKQFANWAIRRAMKRPYFHLDGYMQRYWLVGGSWRDERPDDQLGWKRTWLDSLIGRFIGIRVHHILRSDSERHLHDHPWASVSLILRGGYAEIMPIEQSQDMKLDMNLLRSRNRWPGDIVVRKAAHRHRLVKYSDMECWTLFAMGPRSKRWGFYTPEGWVHWSDYPASREQLTHLPDDVRRAL
jgi:hypothetical protein